jgi:hypothetical protein
LPGVINYLTLPCRFRTLLYLNVRRNDSATADITPDGGVIIIVGVGIKRLKAYSLVLKSALRVFNVILGLRFSEGQRLNANKSTKIYMLKDNAEAIEIMLNVIHSYNNTVHNSLDAS